MAYLKGDEESSSYGKSYIILKKPYITTVRLGNITPGPSFGYPVRTMNSVKTSRALEWGEDRGTSFRVWRRIDLCRAEARPHARCRVTGGTHGQGRSVHLRIGQDAFSCVCVRMCMYNKWQITIENDITLCITSKTQIKTDYVIKDKEEYKIKTQLSSSVVVRHRRTLSVVPSLDSSIPSGAVPSHLSPWNSPHHSWNLLLRLGTGFLRSGTGLFDRDQYSNQD